MLFCRKSARARRVRKSPAPRARLEIEPLETRTVPDALSGDALVDPNVTVGDEFLVDTTDAGSEYTTTVASSSVGDVVVVDGGDSPPDANLLTGLVENGSDLATLTVEPNPEG